MVLRSTGMSSGSVVIAFGVSWNGPVSLTKKQQALPTPGWANCLKIVIEIGEGFAPERTSAATIRPSLGTLRARGSLPEFSPQTPAWLQVQPPGSLLAKKLKLPE